MTKRWELAKKDESFEITRVGYLTGPAVVASHQAGQIDVRDGDIVIIRYGEEGQHTVEAIHLPDDLRLCVLVEVDDPVLAWARVAYAAVKFAEGVHPLGLHGLLENVPDEVKEQSS